MEDRSLFISSCTRRDLARRRARRHLFAPGALTLVVLAAALGAFIAARGGI
jgi:hypothetical protein